MSAPRRWKDMHDAPVGVRELLPAGRPPRAIDRASFERGASRVAKLGAAPAAAAGIVAVGLWTKLAAAAVIGVASVGAVVAVAHVVRAEAGDVAAPAIATNAPAATTAGARSAEAKAAPSVEAKAEAEAEAKPKATTEPQPGAQAKANAGASAGAVGGAAKAEAAVESAPAAPAAAEPSPAPTAQSTLAAEIPLLEAARASLVRDPTTTLAKVAEHRALYPAGVLSAERDLIELDALRRSGRTTETRARGEAWLAREPESMHAARIRAILTSLDPPPTP